MMRRFLPIIIALLSIAALFAFVITQKSNPAVIIGDFDKSRSCTRTPMFFNSLKVTSSVVIDLTQHRFKGIGFISHQNSLYNKQWGEYGHFGTYTLSDNGDIYLAPMPFISIKENTFDLQKNLYKLDTRTGKLSIFMHFDDVHPSSSNPFGVASVIFDCDNKSLWVSTIDETNYNKELGVIMNINPITKEIMQQQENFDALTLVILNTDKGRFLLAGSAKRNSLFAFPIKNNKLQSPIELLELPDSNERIRKIKITGKNTLELQAVKFSYSLIAQSAERRRAEYVVKYDTETKEWKISGAIAL